MATRINKFLSEIGFCSRREADRLIEEGKVKINGKIPEVGTKVLEGDKVSVNGKVVNPPKEEHVYLALNKPVGIVCTTDTANEKKNIIDFVGHPRRIFHIGRLDKPSEGLILLTSDGDIVNKILRAGNNHEKEYIVTVNRPLDQHFIDRMASGIPILDTVTAPCKVKKMGPKTFNIILTQGLNRQIRRMCDYLGYEVVKLKRIRIMNIRLDLPVGKWRDLTPTELEEIRELVADSKKTV
ncbi:Ribosomal large subunit pseudouridine synthase F [Lunatimonas lonarensis]|uniref:Pseudouridine synthase n=1 Tax=Lunatimonas lonarensis TaxID=1232681 RepID=R7ZX81_9BACT|nr:23S rRNA pseudouridine(2604) synthase RluF [Lunatimonas lonarensis]EON78682.1 Ribosomal large subunit pseudouridine synthase F [Lunatimonas lonarensis]